MKTSNLYLRFTNMILDDCLESILDVNQQASFQNYMADEIFEIQNNVAMIKINVFDHLQ